MEPLHVSFRMVKSPYILNFSPANIVSGRKVITLCISPAMQKPHWSHKPSSEPPQSGWFLPSTVMKLDIQQYF